ncbi:MAG TPA: UvrD-helicase domain-containing protein [Frateuria sp.]|uniref:UvrD-helicase domain-containing protein n=1 Tax=Frateuria sp. TaxID=2211372 RepID=UPI002D7ECCAE|nr:UvrD-helicase domain-containing protein [Frateuria sp.]HET6805820.1 UvrD-helicase domain-containing protein [Frateuria sp.]
MSAPLRVHDWSDLPLAHAPGQGGRCLIEASAGTGKTWTIAVLYLRLLLEQSLSPRQIVVTTFTDAAAQELRERLRAKLRAAERLGQAPGAPATGPDEAWLQARWAEDPSCLAADMLRLRLAQAELDLAPVGTLHGLCRRILTDFPFECGSAFRLGELVPGRALDDELIEDLWRRLVQSAGELAAGDLAWWQQGLDGLRRALRAVMKPGVRVRVEPEEDAAALMQPSHARAIREWVGDGSQFKRSNSALLTALRKLADYLEANDRSIPFPDLSEALDRPLESQLKAEFVEDARASGIVPFAQHLSRVLADPGLPARSVALAGYRDALLARREERLRERGQLTFDALITQVHQALAARGGVLADRLFREWPVALVDEFQDTDQQQYAILDRIYRDDEGATRGRLVMIGDPKQAIYRFRGGDIHAYLAARRGIDAELRLDRNFRSSQALVQGFNELYALAGPALSQQAGDAIAYEPVSAGRAARPLSCRGAPVERPLALHLCAEVPPNKDARIAFALDACANHVAALLAGDWQIGDQPLRPGDIAVLLPTNEHVAGLRDRLRERQVPCVGASRSSVFATPLARELQIVLYAIDQPGDEGALRAALATRLLGVGLAELAALRDSPDDWLRHEQRFAQWHRQWRQDGVLAVVQSLLHQAAPALLATPEGERALTDLRHLGELLQQAEEDIPGSEQLLAWLAEQRGSEGAASDDAAEEQQLRIESDARRVRLMTLHASKGLEFPVVLLPLMWAQEGREEKLPLRHDPATGGRELVLGGPAHADACAEVAQEDQDERFRVLYVALTRAELACHVYVLDPRRATNGSVKRPPADPSRSALDATVERLLAAGVANAQHLAWLPDDWSWPYPVAPDAPAATGRLREALVTPAPRPMQQLHSFSTLARIERAVLEDEAASDEAAPSAAPEPDDLAADMLPAPAADDPALLALAGWRGAEFGNAMHAVFEHREVGVPVTRQHALVARCLHEAGVRHGDEPAELLVRRLAARVQATLDAPLAPGLVLGALPRSALRAEMAFHYVVDAVSLDALREACARHGEPTLVPRTSPGILRGLMTGKIDLVFEHAGRFHVLDYKSNWLGERLDAYAPERLPAAMDAHHYRFQALLYTVALDRLLRQRLSRYRRDTHLGEAIYLFVRAVGLGPGAGIWTQRFDDALLDAVDRVLGACVGEPA